jgi:hypothetical protein
MDSAKLVRRQQFDNIPNAQIGDYFFVSKEKSDVVSKTFNVQDCINLYPVGFGAVFHIDYLAFVAAGFLFSSVNYSWVDEITEDIVRIMNGKKVSFLPVPAEKPGKIKNGKYSLDDAHFINISYHKDSLFLETDSPGNFTLFDYNLYKEITDMSSEYEICKTFTSYITSGDLKDFEKYADEKMKKAVFDEKGNALTMNFWNNIVSKVGKCSSINIYYKDEQYGSKNYSMAFHLEKAELLMQLSAWPLTR